jgi:hypothetical protein
LVVLSFSPLMGVWFFQRQYLRTLMTGIEPAFALFGRAPVELSFGHMRSVIVGNRRYSGGPLVDANGSQAGAVGTRR